MELLFVRHTAVDPALKGRCYGQTDVGLLKPHEPSFESIRAQLPAGLPCMSSPAQRCQELAAALNPDFTTDALLWEMNFGDWEMQTWDEIPQAPLQRWMDDFDTEAVPGGESYPQLVDRIGEFLDAIRRKPQPQFLIVTHAGVIRAAMHLLQGVALKETFSHQVGYGEIVKMQLS